MAACKEPRARNRAAVCAVHLAARTCGAACRAAPVLPHTNRKGRGERPGRLGMRLGWTGCGGALTRTSSNTAAFHASIGRRKAVLDPKSHSAQVRYYTWHGFVRARGMRTC